MRRSAIGVWLAVAVAAAATPATASVTEALDLGELVRASDHVLVARVVRQEARWDARRRIVTDVTLEVERSMKGARPGERVVLRRLGGAIGEVGMMVVGEPAFVDGQRAVIFARGGRGGGHLRPVGMSQGVLSVEVDGQGRAMALPGGAGLSLVRRDAMGQLGPAALLHPRPLEELLADVGRLVEEARGR